MNLSEQEYNLIHKYLSKSLNSEQDKTAFQSALEKEDFRNALLDQAKLIDGLEAVDDADTRKLLESFDQDNSTSFSTDQTDKTNSDTTSTFKWLKYLILVAMLCGLAYAGYKAAKDQTNYPEIIAYHGASTFPPQEMDRSMANQVSPLFKKTMGAYARKDYKLAVDGLKQLEPTETNKMFLGNSYFKLKNYEASLEIFEELAVSGDKNLRENAEWYKALSLLGLERKKEAILVLNFIKKQDFHLFDRKAGKLLADLK